MAIDTTKTIREFALEFPASVQVFEKLGIDYCCGGQKPLGEACSAAGLKLENVAAALSTLKDQQESRTESGTDWTREPLEDLIAHITGKHHVYVKQQIPAIRSLLEKVTAKHGANHPELATVDDTFSALADELTMHLMKEEQVLFPYIARAEESSMQHEPAPPSCFGSIGNPIRMMLSEHDSAGGALRKMRQATSGYTAPEDACASFRALYALLQEFEADLHQHIHLENNILFPRAMQTAGLAVAV
jgi:regulator of cell morphogenesis and NO signaling